MKENPATSSTCRISEKSEIEVVSHVEGVDRIRLRKITQRAPELIPLIDEVVIKEEILSDIEDELEVIREIHVAAVEVP